MSNLIIPTSEQARINGSKGGKASVESKKNKKLLSDFLKAWADGVPNDKDKAKLQQLYPNIDDVSNKALLVLPLLKKAGQGDIKAIEMIVKLLGEDRKLEAEIEKLKAENELLKQGSGVLLDKIVINMDVKPDEQH